MPPLLPRSTPAASGVSADALTALLDRLEASAVELHSLMVVRHGHVVAEGWWAPYSAGPPAPALLADQVVHLGRRGARDRRRAALAGRPGGRRPARPRPGRRLGAGAPAHRPPPAVHDDRAPAGQPRRGVAAGAGRPGEGLPARAVPRRRGHPARVRQRDHVRPGPDGGTGHGPRPAGAARRPPLRADGHRPRRVGPGGQRCRVRVPRAAPDHRGRRRLRRTAAARRPLGRPAAGPARVGGARDQHGTSTACSSRATGRTTPTSARGTATSSGGRGTVTTVTAPSASSAWWSRRTISWSP